MVGKLETLVTSVFIVFLLVPGVTAVAVCKYCLILRNILLSPAIFLLPEIPRKI